MESWFFHLQGVCWGWGVQLKSEVSSSPFHFRLGGGGWGEGGKCPAHSPACSHFLHHSFSVETNHIFGTITCHTWKTTFFHNKDPTFKRAVSASVVTARNEVGARLSFYMCLWFCSRGGRGVPRQVPPSRYTPPLGRYNPPGQVHPQAGTHTPGRYTSWPQCMLGYGQQWCLYVPRPCTIKS